MIKWRVRVGQRENIGKTKNEEPFEGQYRNLI